MSVSDLAGNTTSQNLIVNVDLTPPPRPLVTLGMVSDDNIIITADQAGGVVISGTLANLGAGGSVTVVIEGQSHSTTLDANGNWSTDALPVTAFGTGDGSATSQVISGTTDITEVGRTVVVTFNDKTYSAIVQSNGT